jgi:galactose mutarotase-like enzyme
MKHRSVCLEDSDTVELNHEMFEIDAVIFDELKSRKLKLVSKKSGKGIEMEYKDFPYLILWSSANHGNFVAIEPWTGLSTCSDEGDWFEEKRNVQSVEAGESKEYSYSVSVL